MDACTARYIVLCCGRRAGKSVYCEYRLAKSALEGNPVAYFAPINRDTTAMWESLNYRLKDVIARRDGQERRLILSTGGTIDCWSLDNPDNGRGRKYKEVVIDEFCKVKRQEYIWNKTISPSLSDYQGRAIIPSSPSGMDYFWELFCRGDKSILTDGQVDQYPNWQSFSFPTSVNPNIKPEEIEQARRDLPSEAFSQEYLAEFISDSGAVFRNIDSLATADWQSEPIPGHAYSIGVDFGRVRDFSVFAVYDANLKSIVHIDRSNEITTLAQVERLINLCRLFRPFVVIPEQNAIGMGAVELLQARQLPVRPFQTSVHSKARIVEDMVIALEQSNIRLLDDPRLKQEFKAFAREKTESGLIKYGAPRGFHDDIVMACCLARDGAEAGVPQWDMVLV